MKSFLFAAMSLPAVLVSQDPVLESTQQVLPAFRPLDGVQVMADFDGNGRPDLLAILRDRAVLWVATPEASYRELHDDLPGAGSVPTGIVVGDLDGDGDLDVAVSNGPSSTAPHAIQAMLNDGSGGLTALPLGSPPYLVTCMALGDIDGDGDLDLVVGVDSGLTSPFPFPIPQPLAFAYLNQGQAVFSVVPIQLPGVLYGRRANAVTLFDQDADGDLDLHLAIDGFSISVANEYLLRNDGTGQFTTQTMGSFPGGDIRKSIVFDADGDAHPDLLEVQLAWNLIQYLHCAKNDGQGNFVALPLPQTPTTAPVDQIMAADWDGDGASDYCVRRGASLYPFRRQASSFQPLPVIDLGRSRSVQVVDVDADGDSDILLPSQYSDAWPLRADLLLNVGGTFHALPSSAPALPEDSSFLVRLVDLDGDGVLDLVMAPWFPYASGHGGRIWRGDGTGGFSPWSAGDFATQLVPGRGLAFGDVDGDGDVDLICASRPEPGGAPSVSHLYLQQGGSFVAASFPSVQAENPLLGDLDGDHDLDCVLVDWNSSAVLQNDGSGNFTIIGSLPVTGTSNDTMAPAVMADFDGDGDLDVVTRNGFLLSNDGTGVFSASWLGPGPFDVFRGYVVAADCDGDQDVDLVWEAASATAGAACLMRNQGNGSFVASALPWTAPLWTVRVRPADVDGDGWMDLVATNIGGNWYPGSGIAWNDHVGGFLWLPDAVHGSPSSYIGGDIGDVDGDGDVDLLVTGRAGLAIYYGLTHQVAVRGMPLVGRSLGLDLWGRANEPYALAFALGRSRLDVPGFGVLWLDFASLQLWNVGAHDATGHTSFSAALPDLPELVGLPIHWQALSGTAGKLGNVVTSVLQAH